jgi:hypothetical protein
MDIAMITIIITNWGMDPRMGLRGVTGTVTHIHIHMIMNTSMGIHAEITITKIAI